MVNMRAHTHTHTHTPLLVNFKFPCSLTPEASGIFGQPIDKIATDQLQSRPGSGSGAATPISAGSRSGSLQPPSSPTSTDACFMDSEPNPTAVLLEALSKTDKATAPPSPKAQRQLALRPSEPRVPPIVRKAIDYLDQHAVKTEGLFRISGSKARIHEVSLVYVYAMLCAEHMCVGMKTVLRKILWNMLLLTRSTLSMAVCQHFPGVTMYNT